MKQCNIHAYGILPWKSNPGSWVFHTFSVNNQPLTTAIETAQSLRYIPGVEYVEIWANGHGVVRRYNNGNN
jgi:hypothetical protein